MKFTSRRYNGENWDLIRKYDVVCRLPNQATAVNVNGLKNLYAAATLYTYSVKSLYNPWVTVYEGLVNISQSTWRVQAENSSDFYFPLRIPSGDISEIVRDCSRSRAGVVV